MLADISNVDAIYIVCGLSLRYFYPHFFEKALIVDMF